MRKTIGIVLSVIFAVALGMWIRSSSNHANSSVPAAAEATSTPMLPVELMRKAKDLPDNTVREPF
jgi:hypothetical protein